MCPGNGDTSRASSEDQDCSKTHVEEPSRWKPGHTLCLIFLISFRNGMYEESSRDVCLSIAQRIILVQFLFHCSKEGIHGFLRLVLQLVEGLGRI